MADEKKTTARNPIYALAPNDNPRTVITHVVLNESNYEEWAKGFRVSLGAKGKLGFIDGTIPKPEENSPDLDDWWTVNHMIVAWIFNTIDPSDWSSISYRNNARELWEDIRQRYQMKPEIADCKQKSGENFYASLLKRLEEVNHFDALPSYAVPPCFSSGHKCGFK